MYYILLDNSCTCIIVYAIIYITHVKDNKLKLVENLFSYGRVSCVLNLLFDRP